eukprot:TRINITY_DN5543_c0_g5_i1.p1 TRINITY_DN5543_c0_g5~~TRINITY_DN5543_c0_g5_i1.p1  ORF type:complete len:367 (+),score=115.88 TRINITY_DN5543_c0_g5_i1:59-1159(+)
MSLEVPIFTNKKDFVATISNFTFWEPYIKQAYQKNFQNSDFNCNAAPFPGTFPVFILNNQQVLKIFPQFYQGNTAFNTELFVYKLISCAGLHNVPHLITSGNLAQDLAQVNAQWNWPYFFISFLKGTTLKQQRSALNESLFYQFIDELAKLLKGLHKLNVIEFISNSQLQPPERLQPNFFRNFITQQLVNCTKNHLKRQTLPKRLCDQIVDYLPSTIEQLNLFDDPLVFVHADLHEDHIFIDIQRDTNLQVSVTGIIDFNDCMLATQYYELCQIYFHSLLCNKALLKNLIARMNLEICDMQQFVRKCMYLTLLHEYNMFLAIEEGYKFIFDQIESLEQLSQMLFNLDNLNLIAPIESCTSEFTNPD